MTYSASLYFLGAYRPAHFEAKTIKTLAKTLIKAIEKMEPDSREFFASRILEGVKHMRTGNCSKFSAEYGSRGFCIKNQPHDPWLDELTAKLDPMPGLNYDAHQ